MMSPTSAVGMSGRRPSSLDKPVTGRFAPSEPLHMTTRRAARNVHTNTSPSINGSVDENESRRGSLDDGRPTTSNSLGSQGRRISGGSTNGTSDMNISFELQPSTEGKLRKLKSRSIPSPPRQSNIHESPSPSRKRKRSSPSPQSIPNGMEYAYPSLETNDPDSVLDADERVDAVIVVPPELLTDQESEEDSSEEQEMHGFLAATQSTDITPAATPTGSEPVSPVSDESQATPLYSSKRVDVLMADADNMLDADEADELEDLGEGEYGLDDDEIEDDDDQAQTGRKKRLHGRRRAEHPDIEIEARMRRQLQLKSAYRYISRAIKPLLAEIAEKTVEELEPNPALHEEVPEYGGNEEQEGVQELLDGYLVQRKAQLEAQHRYCQAQLRKTLDGEKQVRKSRCENEIENIRQHQVDDLHHDFLLIARQAQLEADRTSHETDDEDGDVIPKPKGMAYRWRRRDGLASQYDSRSRLAMQSENALNDLQRRFEMHNMLKDHGDSNNFETTEGFTVMDSTARQAALARNQSLSNTFMLAEAAAAVQREIPVIPNEEAFGLQLLGDLASRPSIRAAAPLPMTPLGPQLLRQPLIGPSAPPLAPAQMPPPPPLRPPISFEGRSDEGPLRAQMSPRTEKFVSERGGLPFPMQSPLRQPTLPEARPSEPHVRSPSSISSRENQFQSLPTQLFGPEGRLHQQSPSSHHQRHSSTDSFDRQFSVRERSDPSIPGASGRDEASWEKYQRPLTADSESRSTWNQDRTIHDFSRGGPLSIERISTQPEEARNHRPATPSRPLLQPRPDIFLQTSPERVIEEAIDASPLRAQPSMQAVSTPAESTPVHEQESASIPDHIKNESPALIPQAKSMAPILQWEPPSSEGAADWRTQDEAPPSEEPKRDLSLEVPTKKSRSRASSLGQSTTTDVSGSQDGSNVDNTGQRRPRKESSKGQERLKTSKTDRHGLSRKQHKDKKRGGSHTTSLDGGQMLRFRLNTTETTKPATFTSAPLPGTPHTTPGYPPYPPLPAYHDQQNHPVPPPAGFAPPPQPYYGYDQYYSGNHRNSLPGVPPPPWPQLPPSPAYGLPHGPPPPPAGWPGSPSNGLAPLPPRPEQQSPAPPSGSQFGGPPIAPATSDSRAYGFGNRATGGNHPPAFAQQQRNTENSSSRRRAQSDLRGTKFHHYSGPRDRSRD